MFNAGISPRVERKKASYSSCDKTEAVPCSTPAHLASSLTNTPQTLARLGRFRVIRSSDLTWHNSVDDDLALPPVETSFFLSDPPTSVCPSLSKHLSSCSPSARILLADDVTVPLDP
jgi:hypothetical protein